MRRYDYVWDVGAALPGVLEERVKDQDGNPIATYQYVYGLGLISRIDGTTSTHYLSDGLGSTTGVTSSAGAVTDTYSYDVFGALRTQTGASAQPFRFTGEQQDPDVNRQLYYLRARDYDPALGRFWSRDPFSGFLGTPQTQNPYAYAVNNPATLVDPYGLFGLGDIGGAVKSVGRSVGRAAERTVGATVDFASRFATLNCLDAAIGVAGLAAIVLVPEAGVIVGPGAALLRAGLRSGESVAFVTSAAINLSQIDPKEGNSVNNRVNAVGAGSSFAAFLAGTASFGSHIVPMLEGTNWVAAGFATGFSIGQCWDDAF